MPGEKSIGFTVFRITRLTGLDVSTTPAEKLHLELVRISLSGSGFYYLPQVSLVFQMGCAVFRATPFGLVFKGKPHIFRAPP